MIAPRRITSYWCEACSYCERVFSEGEAVVHSHLYSPQERRVFGFAPACRSCYETHELELAGPLAGEERSGACEGCGREITLRFGTRRKYLYCSYTCASRAQAGRAREDRKAERASLECGVCGEAFEARRKDARYCSSACRQKAYRDRA